MARIPQKDLIYEVAQRFRSHCFEGGRSLLWGEEALWTEENLEALWDAFIGHPDEGDRGFFDKWRDQLAGKPVEIRKLAADLLALFLLYPGQLRADTKVKQVEQVMSWVDEDPHPEAWSLLRAAFDEGGIGHTGQHYMMSRPWQLAFLIRFAQAVQRGDVSLGDRAAAEALADRLQSESTHTCHEARHLLLHFLYPEHYERIVSKRHRDAIIATYGGARSDESEDEALARIRAELSADYSGDFDFYKKDVWPQWDPKAVADETPEEGDELQGDSAAGSVWVECTIVRGRPDREEGPYAVGKALWSPQKNRAGQDIYRFMRDVRAGDVVLHLTDKEAVTRVSIAAAAVEDFDGVPDTEWGLQPSYIVRLKDSRNLDPPLHRDRIFNPQNLPRLQSIRSAAPHPVFYQKNGDLRQGAYLTAAPADLVALLNEEYVAVAGRPLVDTGGAESPNPLAAPRSMEWLVEKTLWAKEALEELVEVLGSDNPQVVLAGPPGTGKTWVARHVARFLVDDDPACHRTVQFHPSFGYEEFIEGLRPVSTESGIEFLEVPGVVLQISEGMTYGDERVLIIDEMNRANLPRVFGELMYLFEYRDEAISLQYTEDFRLPKGLKFIGTMNTADRSIRSIDIALRRRFDVFECEPDPKVLQRYYEGDERTNEVHDLIVGMEALNERLRGGLDRHHTIGQTFFMHPRMTKNRLRAVWKRKLKPLIEEYFFDEPDVWQQYTLSEFWPSLGAD